MHRWLASTGRATPPAQAQMAMGKPPSPRWPPRTRSRRPRSCGSPPSTGRPTASSPSPWRCGSTELRGARPSNGPGARGDHADCARVEPATREQGEARRVAAHEPEHHHRDGHLHRRGGKSSRWSCPGLPDVGADRRGGAGDHRARCPWWCWCPTRPASSLRRALPARTIRHFCPRTGSGRSPLPARRTGGVQRAAAAHLRHGGGHFRASPVAGVVSPRPANGLCRTPSPSQGRHSAAATSTRGTVLFTGAGRPAH